MFSLDKKIGNIHIPAFLACNVLSILNNRGRVKCKLMIKCTQRVTEQ